MVLAPSYVSLTPFLMLFLMLVAPLIEIHDIESYVLPSVTAVAGGNLFWGCPSISIHLFHSCENFISQTLGGNFFKFYTKDHLDSRFDFGGQWSRLL